MSETPILINFDTNGSIILGDFLDLILNKGNNNSDKPGRILSINEKLVPKARRLNENSTKLEIYESIAYQEKYRPTKSAKRKQYDVRYVGGIKLPQKNYIEKGHDDEGSGNIIIVGAAGTGKSTLAFQMAAACASDINNGIAVYYSLEVPRHQVVNSIVIKDKKVQNKDKIKVTQLNFFSKSDLPESDEQLCTEFVKSLHEKGKDEINEVKRQILIPNLSPCSMSDEDEKHNQVFLQRFKEIEMLLKAIKAYNDKIKDSDNIPQVKIIIVDSLNAFNNSKISREAMIRLFGLFKHYGILGVFTLGDDTAGQDGENTEAEVAKYLADVVIQLRRNVCNDYTYNSLEVVKSRYVPSALGQHPYKIVNLEGSQKTNDETKTHIVTKTNGDFPNIGIVKKIEVWPSLHYRIYSSEKQRSEKSDDLNNEKENLFGITIMNKILPNLFENWPDDQAQIITVSGDSGLYKSDLAINALISGISTKDDENCLMIRLSDREKFRICGVRMNNEVIYKINKKIIDKYNNIKKDKKIVKGDSIGIEFYNCKAVDSKPYKYEMCKWEYNISDEKKIV